MNFAIPRNKKQRKLGNQNFFDVKYSMFLENHEQRTEGHARQHWSYKLQNRYVPTEHLTFYSL